MRIPGLKTAKLTARRLLGRLRSGAVILGYHRISDDPWDPFDLGVGVERFREQMAVLVERARVVELERLVEDRARADRRARSVAVTFDDGYLECLDEVAPILEGLGAPATVFAISGMLGEEPWWERLSRLLAPSRVLSGPLELGSDGERRVQAAGLEAHPDVRRGLTLEVHRVLAPLAPERRNAELDRLSSALGVEREEAGHRCLTAQELRQLTRSGVVRVGAHGHAHVELGRLPPAEQRRDVERSKQVLEEVLGVPVRGISYPHGSSSAGTPELVRQAGFTYGCCSRPAAVLAASDPYLLPRIWVPDVDGARFERWLTSWTGR